MELPEHTTDGHIYLRQFAFGDGNINVVCIGHSPPIALCGAPWGLISRIAQKYAIKKLSLLNVFSLISPKAKEVGGGKTNWRDWTNAENDERIKECCETADYVICCWGCERLFGRPHEVIKLIGEREGAVKCFAKSLAGRPYHYRGWNGKELPDTLADWPNM